MIKKESEIYLHGDAELTACERESIEKSIAEDNSAAEDMLSLSALQADLSQSPIEPSEQFVSDVLEKIQARQNLSQGRFSFAELFAQGHWLSGACAAALILLLSSVVTSGTDSVFLNVQGHTDIAMNSTSGKEDTLAFESLLFESDSESSTLSSENFLFSDYSEG